MKQGRAFGDEISDPPEMIYYILPGGQGKYILLISYNPQIRLTKIRPNYIIIKTLRYNME